MKIPKKCKDCNCLGDYTKGPFKRSPHYCCELIWDLYEEDYRVNPDVLDENCPKKKMDEVLDKLFDNVTPFKQVVKSDKDIYYIDYSKHETTTGTGPYVNATGTGNMRDIFTVLETPDRLEDNKPDDNIIRSVVSNGESLFNFKREVSIPDYCWHDVKAELPLSSQHIIIQTSDCDISQYGFFWINEKKFTKSWEDEEPIPNVVAWMYMPETSDKFFKMPQCNG